MSKCREILFAALLVVACGARADVGEQWISIAVETLRDAREAPDATDRQLAMVRLAIDRAMAGTLCPGSGALCGASAAQRERREAAVAVAAFAVLDSLHPDQHDTLETRLALAFSYIPETAAKAEGAALGRRIANGVLAGAP